MGSLLLDEPKFKDEFIENVTKGLPGEVKEKDINLLEEDKIWTGKDILEQIKSSSIPQEIGSHSYSHVIFGDKKISKEIALHEFKKGKEVLEKYNETPVSFVFPRNSINYLDELANSGFKTYRGLESSWYVNTSGIVRKMCHIFDQTLAITPPTVTPKPIKGLVNIPASMLYLPMNGFRKYIPLKSRIIKAQKGIKKAIDKKEIFHLWFHPFNIATDQEKLFYGLEEIFKLVKIEREKGNLEVVTMGEVAKMYGYLHPTNK